MYGIIEEKRKVESYGGKIYFTKDIQHSSSNLLLIKCINFALDISILLYNGSSIFSDIMYFAPRNITMNFYIVYVVKSFNKVLWINKLKKK